MSERMMCAKGFHYHYDADRLCACERALAEKFGIGATSDATIGLATTGLAPMLVADFKHPLADATDDQLRAECERRNIWEDEFEYTNECDGCGHFVRCDTSAERDAAKLDHEARCALALPAVRRERDDWKRRAEAAEARIADAKPYEFLQSRYATEGVERGHGIAATKPDTSHWVDPWDFLEDA